MTVKKCPECKSHNTRQMSRPETAYCLSCYHKFKNVIKVEVVQVKVRERNKKTLEAKIQHLEVQLTYYRAKLQDINACSQQKSTKGN